MDTFKIEAIKAPASDQLKEKIRILDKLCFPNHYVKSDQKENDGPDRFCSNRDLKANILAWEGDLLVGETEVYERTILLNKTRLLLGGIGSVATHPDKRRKGIATMMVKRAMNILMRDHCDIAYLCTDQEDLTLVHFYEKFDFRRLGKPHTYLGKSGKRFTDHDGMIAAINSQEIVNKILSSDAPFDIGVGNW